MTLTRNSGIGLSMGVLMYPIFMIAEGRCEEVRPAFQGIVACSSVFLMTFPSKSTGPGLLPGTFCNIDVRAGSKG